MGNKGISPPPLLGDKHYHNASEYTPENLMREARRQKVLVTSPVPEICVLDPDGDIVRHLVAIQAATRDPAWACYHSKLHRFSRAARQLSR